MAMPFKQFCVVPGIFTRRYKVEVLDRPTELFGTSTVENYVVQDWRSDVRRFIEAAIREKIARESS